MLRTLNLVNFSSSLLQISVTYRETSHICVLYKLRRSSEHHLLFPGLTQEVVRSHIPKHQKILEKITKKQPLLIESQRCTLKFNLSYLIGF